MRAAHCGLSLACAGLMKAGSQCVNGSFCDVCRRPCSWKADHEISSPKLFGLPFSKYTP